MLNKNLLSYLLILMLVLIPAISNVTFAQENNLKEVSITDEIKNLCLNVSGAKITFDEDSEQILVSEDLKVEKDGNTLTISSPKKIGWFNHKTYTLIIGTVRDYSYVNIDVGGADMNGTLKAKRITINGGGLDIRADLQADRISINSGGLEMRNKVSAGTLAINGGGMDIDINAEGIKNIDLNGAGISARIKYLDSWAGYRNLEVNGVGGSIKLVIPSHNDGSQDGQLNVDRNGIIDVSIGYYDKI